MIKAKFTSEQQPVKTVIDGEKVYVFICLNGVVGTETKKEYDGEHGTEEYIEYDYNEFVVDKDAINLDDIINDPEKYLSYAPDSQINDMTLDEYKMYRQEENKMALADFLRTQTVIFNGKEYGVSEEDQNEMALNLTQYQVLTASGQDVSLEWHSKREKCEKFTQEEFIKLIAMIKAFVYPYYQKMQDIKTDIFNSKNKFELSAIEIKYE